MSIFKKHTVNLPKRRVIKDILTDQYVVMEQDKNGNEKEVSRGYDHQTSAYAALGRLTQKESGYGKSGK